MTDAHETTAMQRTTEQRRAASAWERVRRVRVMPESRGQAYGRQARRLASLVQVNGLGQTLAFLRSKPDNEAMQALYRDVSDWVVAEMRGPAPDLLDCIRLWSSSDYRRATAETMAYALWLRRFVEAEGWGQDEEDD